MGYKIKDLKMSCKKNLSSASSSTSARVRVPLCFFKVYMPDQSSQQLELPSEFVKRLSYVTPRKSVLLCCGQKIWSVGVVEVENRLFLKNGWIDFINDTFLESGDFLVFSYSGGAKFNVQIYGQTTCEKNYTFLSETKMKGDDDKTVQHGEDLNDSSDDDYEDQSTSEDSEISDEFVYEEELSAYSSSSHEKQMKKCGNEKCTEGKKCPSIRGKVKRKLWNRADIRNRVPDVPYETKLPHFKMKMLPNYVYHGSLNIPMPFGKENLKFGMRKIVLKASDNSWPVTLQKYSNGCCKISGGWLTFVRGNCIKVGDICMFELIDKINFTFKVSIFRDR